MKPLFISGQIENLSKNREHITIGNQTTIDGRVLVFAHDGKIRIGDWCYVGQRTEIWSMASVDIGNRVFISHNVNIHDNISHPLDSTLRHEDFVHIFSKGGFGSSQLYFCGLDFL